MQCGWCHDEMQQTNKYTQRQRRTLKASGASVSGCYNTPPLQEDLVPRSRMAPERNGRGRGKTNCFFDKRVKPKNLERSQSLKKWHNGGEHNLKHSVQQEEQGTLRERCRLKDMKQELNGSKKIWPPRYNEIAKEQEWQNLDSTPVEKRRKLDEMKRYWRDDATLQLNG